MEWNIFYLQSIETREIDFLAAIDWIENPGVLIRNEDRGDQKIRMESIDCEQRVGRKLEEIESEKDEDGNFNDRERERGTRVEKAKIIVPLILIRCYCLSSLPSNPRILVHSSDALFVLT